MLRRSVVDFSRRAEVSRRATDRYLTALAAVEIKQTLAQEAVEICRASKRDGQRYRGLIRWEQTMPNSSSGEPRRVRDQRISYRDIRQRLYGTTKDKAKERKQMAAVGRKIRLLRGHGLVAKVSKTHRYVVTAKGRRLITAMLAARQASTEKLTALAA